jgi:clan AA aspartic protease (TIGR02281 family)
MKASKQQLGGISTWVVLFLIVAFWVWFFKADFATRFKLVYEQFSATKVAAIKDKIDEVQAELEVSSSQDQCATVFPKHASKFRFESHDSDAKLHARLHVNNEHSFSVLIVFHKIKTDEAFGAVILHPNKSTQLNIPVGHYRLAIQSGEEWCNWHKGFADGVEINASQQIEVRNDQVPHLRLISFGHNPADAMLSIKSSFGMITTDSDTTVEGAGSLLLQRFGGHYAVEGTINQLPVYFLVDTGASEVSVSETFAKQAGINGCKSSKRTTANGLVEVCEAIAAELSFGQFRLRNVKVSYSKGMSADTFLLGMNVIGLFRVEQQGDVMRLTIQ